MELTIKDALLKGIEAHKSGKIKEADQLYTAILKVQPNNPDANHNLGVLAVGLGKINEALTFFKTALEVNPSVNQFWMSYIDALIKLEKIEEANEILRKANDKEQQGMIFDKFEEVYNNMGVILKNKGYFEEAIGSFSQALKIKPDYAEAYNNLGTVQMEKSDTEAAIKSFKRALKIKPNTPEVYINLGAVHYIKGELDAAVENYKQALKINPFTAEAYNLSLIHI